MVPSIALTSSIAIRPARATPVILSGDEIFKLGHGFVGKGRLMMCRIKIDGRDENEEEKRISASRVFVFDCEA